MYQALSAIYPNHKWQAWRFESVPMSFWSDIKNQCEYFEWLGNELEIRELDEWSQVSISDVTQNSGETLLNFYGGSLYNALSACFPQHNWQESQFGLAKATVDLKEQRMLFDNLAIELNITSFEGWYAFKAADVKQYGSLLLRNYNGSLVKALLTIYPEYAWQPWKLEEFLETIGMTLKIKKSFLILLPRSFKLRRWMIGTDLLKQMSHRGEIVVLF